MSRLSPAPLARTRARLAAGVSLALLALAAPAAAEEAAGTVDLGTIVVAPNRVPTETAKVASSVTVVTREELEAEKGVSLTSYLDRLPGFSAVTAGGPGGTVSFSMRGAAVPYVLVRIDGVDVSDPSQPQVAAALENLTVGDVERIEVLRGSQGALYGGTAVGGVIDITTKGASEKGLHGESSLEGGSFGTLTGRAGVTWADDRTEVGVTVQHLRTDGISSANERRGNPETDPYENTTVTGRVSHRITEQFRLFANARYTAHDVHFDDFAFVGPRLGPVDEAPGAPRNHTVGESFAGRAGAEVILMDGRFRNVFAGSLYTVTRDTFGSFPGWFDGRRSKFEYLGDLQLHERIGLSFGFDHQFETADTFDGSTGFAAGSETSAVFGQANVEPLDGLTLSAAARVDRHDTFGVHPTYRLGAAWTPLDGTKLRATWGTGFRAPSLYELYAPFYGNAALKPEESTSIDAGIDQSFWNGRLTLSATWFRLETDNLIQFAFPAGYFQAPGLTLRQGVELSAKARVHDTLVVDASYTYTDAETAAGTRLIRVPRDKVTLGATWTPTDKATLAVRATHVAGVADIDYTQATSPVRTLPSWFLLDATASYKVTDNLEVYVKGKNLTNTRYEELWGYGTPGLAVYGGVTARF